LVLPHVNNAASGVFFFAPCLLLIVTDFLKKLYAFSSVVKQSEKSTRTLAATLDPEGEGITKFQTVDNNLQVERKQRNRRLNS
jgi:hypothetical protein